MSPSRPADVLAVIPVFNKAHCLEQCVGSVLAAAEAEPGVTVVVVDNGSTDQSPALLRRLCDSRATLHERPGVTVAAVRNTGARLVDSSVIAFLDADCVVPPDYFAELRAVLADDTVAGAGRWVDLPEDRSWIERAWHRLHRSVANGIRPYLNGANFAVRRSAFEAVGGFDETLVTGEDAELGARLTSRGYRLLETDRLAVLHVDNPRTLRAFFHKEVWRGLGMFGTVRAGAVDLPTAAMFAHLAALAGAAGLLVAPAWTPLTRLAGAAVACFAIPGLTVAYRVAQGRRGIPVVAGTVLYQVYYLARLTALAAILRRRHR